MVPAKQGVYAIVNYDNLRQKASMCFQFSLKILEATFFVGIKKNENVQLETVCIRETPVRGVRSLPPFPPPPPTKNPRYGPGSVLIVP